MYTNVTEYKNKILLSKLTSDYQVEYETIRNFQPELYVTSLDVFSEYENLITNEPLQKIKFNNIKDFKDYKYNHKNIGNDILYGDVAPEYQFIKEHFNNIKDKPKARYWYLDIETSVPKKGFPNPQTTPVPITLIQISENSSGTDYIFSYLKVYKEQENVKYFYLDNEKQMLEAFIQYNALRTPVITTAYNGDGFDFPYLVNRMEVIGLDSSKLSPFGVMEEHKTVMFGVESKIKKPVGTYWIDTIDLIKKADPSGKESWSLEYISKYILGDEIGGKMDYKKSGYTDMRAFITNDYNPELDLQENSELKQAYENNDKDLHNKLWWTTFVDYGIIDSQILKKIDNKLGLCDMILNMAQTMSCNVYDVFATIKPWTIYIWNTLKVRNQFLPSKSPFETYHTVGGYVFANPGLHNWVFSADYTSLYPFCLISLNLSPETYIRPEDVPNDLKTLIEPFYRYADDETKTYSEDIYMTLSKEHKQAITSQLIKYNYVLAPNGSLYRKDKLGILPELNKNIYLSRKAYKKKMNEAKGKVEELKKENKDYSKYQDEVNINDTNQKTQKTLINSMYGAVASKTMNIANSDISNAITSYGRMNIKYTINKIITKINELNPEFKVYLSQADTDSGYFEASSVVKYFEKQNPNATIEDKVKFLESFMLKVVQPIIDESSKEISEMFNAYENSLNMDFEIIADRYISAAPKKYSCRIYWDEGTFLAKPKKKITGISIKRSDTPADARIELDKTLDFIFEDKKNDLIDFITKYEQRMKSLKVNDIAIPMGINDLDKFVQNPNLSKPMHVRASIVYNDFITKKNLENYQRINSGDKIKFIFLKRNPITPSNVIAFNDENFIYEVGLDKFIDYKTLYERTFMSPVKSLTDAIGWETTKSSVVKKLF